MNSSDWGNFGLQSGLGGLGAGIAGLFMGGNNPADAGMGYLNQIPDKISPYYQPYMDAGQQSLPQLQQQYGNLINDPGGMLNKIGGGFQQSPGFKFALDQALQGAGHSAAAGGMAGSPAAQQQAMGIATQMGNQDYNNWLHNAMGMYGQGLGGLGGLANMGFNASKGLSDNIAQALASQAQLAYAGKANQNQQQSSLLSGLGSLAAFAA